MDLRYQNDPSSPASVNSSSFFVSTFAAIRRNDDLSDIDVGPPTEKEVGQPNNSPLWQGPKVTPRNTTYNNPDDDADVVGDDDIDTGNGTGQSHQDFNIDAEDLTYSYNQNQNDTVDEINPDDEDDILIAPYRRPLRDRPFVTERSSLLRGTPPGLSTNDPPSTTSTPSGSYRTNGTVNGNPIHPSWGQSDGGPTDNSTASSGVRSTGGWLDVVWIASGIQLVCVGVHDIFIGYLWYRLNKGTEPVGWQVPLFVPPEDSLLLFGAFSRTAIIDKNQWWRVPTSVFLSSSVAEWLLGLCAWTNLKHGTTWGSSGVLILSAYIGFVLFGQAMILLFGIDATTGCVSFGTAGVLCVVGDGSTTYVTLQRSRVVSFLCSMGFLLLAVLAENDQGHGSVVAVFGTSLLGVVLRAATKAWSRPKDRKSALGRAR